MGTLFGILAFITVSCGCQSRTSPEAVGVAAREHMEQMDQREVKRALESAEEYFLRVKRWRPEEFRIDLRGLRSNGKELVVWGVFLEDEKNPRPGQSQSVELHISLEDFKVLRELKFQ